MNGASIARVSEAHPVALYTVKLHVSRASDLPRGVLACYVQAQYAALNLSRTVRSPGVKYFASHPFIPRAPSARVPSFSDELN